jgi:hypothetical protein
VITDGGACAVATNAPAQFDQVVTLHAPQRFAMLPAWAMDGGRPPEPVDARILPDVEWILVTYRLRVTAGRETGHLSHGDGTAVDMVPANGDGQQAWDNSALRLAQDVGWVPSCAGDGAAPACPLKPWVRFVGYNGYPNHGDPAHTGPMAHIHVSWSASAQGASALSPPNDWVRVFPSPPPAARRTPRPATASSPAGSRSPVPTAWPLRPRPAGDDPSRRRLDRTTPALSAPRYGTDDVQRSITRLPSRVDPRARGCCARRPLGVRTWIIRRAGRPKVSFRWTGPRGVCTVRGVC